MRAGETHHPAVVQDEDPSGESKGNRGGFATASTGGAIRVQDGGKATSGRHEGPSLPSGPSGPVHTSHVSCVPRAWPVTGHKGDLGPQQRFLVSKERQWNTLPRLPFLVKSMAGFQPPGGRLQRTVCCLFGVKKYVFFSFFIFLCLIWHVIEGYG